MISILLLAPYSLANEYKKDIDSINLLEVGIDEIIVFESEEIINSEELYERAKKGVVEGPVFKSKSTLQKVGSDEKEDIKTSFSFCLKSFKNYGNAIWSRYLFLNYLTD